MLFVKVSTKWKDTFSVYDFKCTGKSRWRFTIDGCVISETVVKVTS